MDLLVALPAANQGLPSSCCHTADPEGSLPLSWSGQVRELSDMVDFTILR
jgi:hypothetical protein